MNLTTKKNWKTVKLGDLVVKVIDNRGKTPPIVESGLALLEVNAITEKSRFPEYGLVKKFVDQNTYDTWFRTGHIKKGDIIIPTVGTIGNVAVSLENRGSIAQNLIALRFKEENDSLFLYYLLKTPTFKKQIFNLDIGGVQPSVKVPHLLDSEIKIPESIDEQREIAGVLGCLDDKIELLRKENKMLDAIARTLFKRWFVDFEFPNATGIMIDSELGKIPEGWRAGKLENICSKIASGGTPSTKEDSYWNGDVKWFSTKELQDQFLLKSEKTISEEGLSNSSAKLFPENTVVVAIYAAPTVGRLGILTTESTFNQAACGLIANEEMVSFEYIYLLLHISRETLNQMANGAAQQNLSVGTIREFKVVIPVKEISESFRNTVRPIFRKIKNNTLEIQALSNLRDELLNKIFSN